MPKKTKKRKNKAHAIETPAPASSAAAAEASLEPTQAAATPERTGTRSVLRDCVAYVAPAVALTIGAGLFALGAYNLSKAKDPAHE